MTETDGALVALPYRTVRKTKPRGGSSSARAPIVDAT